MIQKSFVFFFAGLCVTSVTMASKYDLCRVEPRNKDQLLILGNLKNSVENIMFLNKVQEKFVPVFAVIPSPELHNFSIATQGVPSTCRHLEKNIQPDMLSVNVADAKLNNREYSWTEYHELDDTYNWLKSLVDKFPKQVSLITPGHTFEHRTIFGVKISFQKNNKAVIVDGGAHGSEWITPAVVNYITHQVLTKKDLKFRTLIEKYDWYIIPHTNPDGYVYTHTADRFWRKTVSWKKESTKCFGVDLNRNWGYHWNENNEKYDPCSNSYPGPQQFSEIETKTLSHYFEKLKNDKELVLHLTIDGFNQWLFSPFGYANVSVRNSDDLKRVTEAAIDGIKRNFGIEYSGGQMSSVLYPIFGTSMDWTYGQLGIDHSYILQLSPKVKFGQFLEISYLVPSRQIVPIGEEALCALVEMIEHI